MLVALVDRLARRLRGAPGACAARSMLRLRFDDFSRATRSHTLPEATARRRRSSPRRGSCSRRAMPLIERRGLTLVGVALANLDDDGAVQLALPLEDRARERARRRARRRARPLRRPTRSRARCCSAATPGLEVPLLPD